MEMTELDKLECEWYDWLYTHSVEFQIMGLAEKAYHLMCIMDYLKKYELEIPMGKIPESNVVNTIDTYERNMKNV